MLELFIDSLIQYALAIIPWLILGSFLAAIAETQIKPNLIKKVLGKFSYSKLFAAELLGMISPLSILSFIPIADELVTLGASPGLLFSFFIAERAYDLQAFFIVSGLFGLKMATTNAVAIFISLVVTAIYLKNHNVKIKHSTSKTKITFLSRQLKLFSTVSLGIIIGATMRTLIPPQLFSSITGSTFGGIISALILGFTLYFGPLAGNYPVARAFADLGMSPAGILTFLTVSPIFNLVIIIIFSSIIGLRKTLKPVLIYTAISILASVLFSFLL